MTEPAPASQGTCPRCASQDVEREVTRFTTVRVMSGVIFFCNLCGLTARCLTSDRELWYDTHKSWASPEIGDDTLEAFLARWPKAVGRPAYGDAEPIGPILPRT